MKQKMTVLEKVVIAVLALALSMAIICMSVGIIYLFNGSLRILMLRNYISIFSISAVIIIACLNFFECDILVIAFKFCQAIAAIVLVGVAVADLFLSLELTEWLLGVAICYATISIIIVPLVVGCFIVLV